MDYVKDRNPVLGSIKIAEQLKTLSFLQNTPRTETPFLVRSKSPSR